MCGLLTSPPRKRISQATAAAAELAIELEHKNPNPASIEGLEMSWQPLLCLPRFRLHFR